MKPRYTPKPTLDSRLAAYSAAAGAALLALAPVSADAQVVYTDLDPDQALATGEDFLIDFDGDGTDDLQFVVDSPFANFFRARVLPDDPNNGGVVGYGPVAANYNYFYASVLNNGASISGTNTIQNTNSTTAGDRDDFLLTSTFGANTYGNWGGVTDQFVGIRFNAGGGTTHYGWVRLDVTSAQSITIKDYAYQATADMAITAGDVGVAVEPGALPDGYAFTPIGPNPIRSTAHFSLMVAETEDVRVSVFDMLGREVSSVFEGQLAGGIARRMELRTGDLPTGTYVVRATGDTFDTVQRVTVTH